MELPPPFLASFYENLISEKSATNRKAFYSKPPNNRHCNSSPSPHRRGRESFLSISQENGQNLFTAADDRVARELFMELTIPRKNGWIQFQPPLFSHSQRPLADCSRGRRLLCGAEIRFASNNGGRTSPRAARGKHNVCLMSCRNMQCCKTRRRRTGDLYH